MAVNINVPSQVKTYANLAAFPATGALKTIYIAEDTNKTYRWTGSVYVEVSASAASGITIGSTAIASGVVGRVLFEGAGNVVQESSSLFWDATNNRLGIGTSSPAFSLDVNGTARVSGVATLQERVNIEADSTVSTQSSAVIASTTTNSNLVLSPNGTGALVAQIPDGTPTGGNARGQYALDLQLGRTSNFGVASGNYSVALGFGNRASGDYSTIVGGSGCTASGQYSISGGVLCVASGNSSIALGILSNASNTEAIAIGRGTASGQNSLALQQGTASGIYSFATTLGNASGDYSVALGRYTVANSSASCALPYSEARAIASLAACEGIARGLNSIVAGQYSQSQTTAPFSSVFGSRSNAYLQGQNTNAGGFFAAIGDAQQSNLTTRREAALTTGAATVLSLDGTGTTNLIIPNGNNRAWNVQIDTIAVVTAITGTATGVSVGDTYRETKQLLFKRVGGTSSIVGTVDTTAIKNDTSMATASLGVTAGASQQMALTFTAPTFGGGGSVTCRVVSKVMLVEVAY